MKDIQERYDKMVGQGFHHGAFQSIELVWLSDDDKSVLGLVCLPASWGHERDAFYHAHPAVLDGAIQMFGFLLSSTATETWVPAGISSVNAQSRKAPWTRSDMSSFGFGQ